MPAVNPYVPAPPKPTFREHASGLLVPNDISREREVWTHDEVRLVNRAIKFLEGKGLQLQFRCPDARCRTGSVTRVRNLDGSITLQCAHKDRVLSRKDLMPDTPRAWVDFTQIAWFGITLPPALQTTKHLGHWDRHPVTARSNRAHAEGIADHLLWLSSAERAAA